MILQLYKSYKTTYLGPKTLELDLFHNWGIMNKINELKQ